jgi:DNA repair protein RecN (Recombination protein N)
MEGARFKTSFAETEPTPTGIDKIEFLLAPNRGEGEQSLQKAVSGGELSRVLLAFKTVTAKTDTTPLLIFDEVDSGISGEIGNKIGDALRKLGKTHQVLTITHLHQVACRANSQLAVKKHEENGRTFTEISLLSKENRIFEIVRMLGEPSSETAKEHAQQLLETKYE